MAHEHAPYKFIPIISPHLLLQTALMINATRRPPPHRNNLNVQVEVFFSFLFYLWSIRLIGKKFQYFLAASSFSAAAIAAAAAASFSIILMIFLFFTIFIIISIICMALEHSITSL